MAKQSVWLIEDDMGNIIAPPPPKPLDGHATLLLYQPAIEWALLAEHAAEDNGGKLNRMSVEGQIIAACIGIYQNPFGTDAHENAAQLLIDTASQLHFTH